MHAIASDRLPTLFILETAWLLAVLQLAETAIGLGAGATAVAIALVAGAVALLVAMTVPRVARRSTTLSRSLGIALFAASLYGLTAASADRASGLTLACLGLILAVTGLARPPGRRVPAGGDPDRSVTRTRRGA